MTSPRPGGRAAEAARNDQVILETARDVFVGDPSAPMSAVAEAAGVGVGGLYRRYASKEQLLRRLCWDGLQQFVAVAEQALAAPADESFAVFLRGIVDSDVHSLTVRLAGTFTPTTELHDLAAQADRLLRQIVRRAKAAGALRADLHANDVPMLFEQLTAVHGADQSRTAELRSRYVALLSDALAPRPDNTRVPGRPPTDAELGARWR